VANLVRTSFLVWAAANRGLAQMEAWHDLAGLLVMLIVLPSLLGLACIIRQKIPTGRLNRQADSLRPVTQLELPPMPQWAWLLALIWIGVGELGGEAWYRLHETKLITNARWSVAWPAQNLRFKKASLPEKALTILRCSNSEAATWEDEEGNLWSGFLLRWRAGKNSAQLAKGHRPDICLPAAGARLLNDFDQVNIPCRDFEIPFGHQAFDSAGKVVHVFYCLWPDRVSPDETRLLEDGSQKSRMLAVLAGKRNLGQQVLEVVISGPDSQDEAVALMKSKLPALVQMD